MERFQKARPSDQEYYGIKFRAHVYRSNGRLWSEEWIQAPADCASILEFRWHVEIQLTHLDGMIAVVETIDSPNGIPFMVRL